jgi:protein-S-isoprenylcysteine O-methyltransferase Ste14
MLTKLGNWLFHYRNILFPVFYVALFIPSPVITHHEKWALVIGSMFIAAGIITRCITIGLVYIIRGGSRRQIHAETLVTGGIYQLCRNPMYLGNMLLLFGFGIFANSTWFVLLFFPLFVIFYAAIIHAEEDFLLLKFGNEYGEYKRRSNAILPQWEKIKPAFRDQTFQWKKVIRKEYTSLFLYLSGICLLLYYRNHLGIKSFLVMVMGLLILFMLTRNLKRRRFFG